MTDPQNTPDSYSDLSSDFSSLFRPRTPQSFSDIPTDLCNRSEYGDAEHTTFSDQQQVGESEPWDTPTTHTYQPPPRDNTPQPNTCRHCHQPTHTINLRGLTIHINPTPATTTEQITTLLARRATYTLTPPTPYTPALAHWLPPHLHAQHLLGTLHLRHPIHTTHHCPRSTP